MKHLLKVLIVPLLLFTSISATDNFFQQSDKQMHIGAGFAIAMGSAPILHQEYGLTSTQSYWAGVGVAILAGLAKELYDSRSGGTGFDGQDLLATGLGGMGGALIVFPLYEYKF